MGAMTAHTAPDYGAVLRTISAWDPADRFALIEDVLRTLAPPSDRARRRREALQQLEGMLAHVKPTPTDADIERWLDEERVKKYG
jgi:hypothetical protein